VSRERAALHMVDADAAGKRMDHVARLVRGDMAVSVGVAFDGMLLGLFGQLLGRRHGGELHLGSEVVRTIDTTVDPSAGASMLGHNPSLSNSASWLPAVRVSLLTTPPPPRRRLPCQRRPPEQRARRSAS
jgi:hypothetical protein